VTLTQAGKTHFDRGSRDSSDLGLLIRQLRIAQDRLRARAGDNER
jgi:hypothetical protein